MWVSVEPDLFNEVYNKVANSPIINKYVDGRVFDCVQKDAEYPYIYIGETNVTNDQSSTSMTEEVGVVVHVYSQYPTRFEAGTILKALGFVLNNRIEIKQYDCEGSRIDYQQVFTDIDQYTKHGVIRLLFKYRHKTKIEGV